MIPLRKTNEPSFPFRTTAEQVMNLAKIMVAMEAAGLGQEFIVEASTLAQADQGVYDLMAMWLAADGDREERDEIVADIQESIDDYREAPSQPLNKPLIGFDKLEGIVNSILENKKRLRELIDRHGGVSQVAKASGIPQPSLSRLLNSASMPRRSTLYKIANALNVSEEAIVTEWTR